MLASLEKGYILSHIFDSPNIKDCLLMKITIEGNPAHRSLAAAILASILSS